MLRDSLTQVPAGSWHQTLKFTAFEAVIGDHEAQFFGTHDRIVLAHYAPTERFARVRLRLPAGLRARILYGRLSKRLSRQRLAAGGFAKSKLPWLHEKLL